MKIGRSGVWFPVHGLGRADLVRLAQDVERLKYDVLWYPESVGYESDAAFSRAFKKTFGRAPAGWRPPACSLAALPFSGPQRACTRGRRRRV